MSGEYKTILDGTIEVKKKLEDLLWNIQQTIWYKRE
jgi:hypothetical protein